MDESYSLKIQGSKGENLLEAETIWGALRGLETFSQLVSFLPGQGYAVEVLVLPLFSFICLTWPTFWTFWRLFLWRSRIGRGFPIEVCWLTPQEIISARKPFWEQLMPFLTQSCFFLFFYFFGFSWNQQDYTGWMSCIGILLILKAFHLWARAFLFYLRGVSSPSPFSLRPELQQFSCLPFPPIQGHILNMRFTHQKMYQISFLMLTKEGLGWFRSLMDQAIAILGDLGIPISPSVPMKRLKKKSKPFIARKKPP